MGPVVKNPITGRTIGEIDGKEIKDPTTGKTTGIIEDDADDSDDLAGCVAGAIFTAAFFVLVLPFYGTLGALALLFGGHRRLGCILILLTLATWVTMITFSITNRETVGTGLYSIIRMRNENIMNMLMWIWGIYNFVIQPAIVKTLRVLEEENKSQ